MYCINCGNKVSDGIKFCGECGKKISDDTENHTHKDIVSTQVSNFNAQNNTQVLCQLCGVNAPVKYNEFYANIGMLFARRQISIKANMCKDCTNKYFWKYTLTNIFLGWWGVISFFATCFFMLNNTIRYISSLSLKKHY